MINTLKEALSKIERLEKENKELKEELQKYQARKYGGRKKHDKAWMTSYQEFAMKYESGMNIMKIVDEGDISRRTAYRYKSYYDELKKIEKKKS